MKKKDDITEQAEFTVSLDNVAATERLGALLAAELADGIVIYLKGELGAGKTSLVRGALRSLGYQGAVKSPTYTLLEEYSLQQLSIIHFDLYRLDDPEELDLIGIRDYFNGKNCCFIEWPDRGQGYLPAEDLQIDISLKGEGRIAGITANSEAGIQLLQRIR